MSDPPGVCGGDLRRGSSPLVVSSEPACLTLRDAVSSEFEVVRVGQVGPAAGCAPRWFVRGCLYDAARTKVPLSLRAPDALAPDGQPPDSESLGREACARATTRLPGRTLFLGTFMNHYGHFITESLSRYWGPEPADRFDHLVSYTFVHNKGRPFVQRFHRHLTEILGIPIKRVRFLGEPVRFDEIVVPEQLWRYDKYANARLRNLYARIIDRHAAKAGGRVFLSRASYAGARLSNILDVEDVFARFGFKVLYPEEVPIQRQLSLYANCEILAGPSVSGMHNCLFTSPGTMTIEVGDRRSAYAPHRVQQIANAISEVDAHFVPMPSPGTDQADIALLTAMLRELLGERPRLGGQIALRLRRAALRIFSPKRAAWRRERYPTKGRR
jgi:hypothetical protein